MSTQTLTRWECTHHESPVLLGTYDDDGTVHLKVRDHIWHVDQGTVRTACPRCGKEHRLKRDKDGTLTPT